jgi:hypothetical protein
MSDIMSITAVLIILICLCAERMAVSTRAGRCATWAKSVDAGSVAVSALFSAF